MDKQQVSYCIAHTLQERMIYFESQIEQIIRQKQHFKQNVGYFNAPLMEFDRKIAQLRAEQKRVHDLMTGATLVQEAEYEIIN